MLTDEEIMDIRNRAKMNDNRQIDAMAFARDIERAVLAESGEQKADLYIVYNGVCISGLYYDAESAKAYADSKQKEHSLSGSIASFHVKEMYCRPLPAQAIPEGWQLVPVEPAASMIDAGVAMALQVSVHGEGGWSKYLSGLYKQMLYASPEPE